MQGQIVRVILASEYPKVRHLLGEALAEEPETAIVGQAENATRVLTLAKKLRPDVAIIDCYLPYTVGLDAVPLSRIGGLDTAQIISQEIPNIKVILLTNLDIWDLPDDSLSSDVTAVFSTERMGASTPFGLQDLFNKVIYPDDLIFANVSARPRASLRQKIANLRREDVLFGGLGILGGVGLMVTLALAGAWLLLVLAGAAAIGFGTGLFWKTLKSKQTER